MSNTSNPGQRLDEHEDQRDEQDASDDASSAMSPRERRRRTIELLIACAVLAIGLVIAFQGVMQGVTGDDRSNYPSAVESVVPIPDTVQAFRTSSVVVDLQTGYTGALTIDGVALNTVDIGEIVPADVQSGQQITLPPDTIYEPGNATLTFTPSSDAAIAEFSTGKHTVIVTYWQIVDGPQQSLTYTWSFNVS